MILFLGLIVTGVVLLIRYLIPQSNSECREDTALEILKRRYARSEISREEYEEKRKTLL
jgi:putative membrane protein